MLHKILVGLLMAGLAAAAAAETVYKWIDSSGQIHYTDLPPRESGARVLGIYQQEAGFVEEESDGYDYGDEGGEEPPDGSGAQTGMPTTAEPPVSEAARTAAEADVARMKVQQCKAAQDRYQRYIESRRLFREMPDGKRQYLTDQELTEARAQAKQAVSDYCN